MDCSKFHKPIHFMCTNLPAYQLYLFTRKKYRSNLNKIYEELGWESLTDRRWSRRLIHFYKIQNNYTPPYLESPIPPPRHICNVLREITCKTNRYKKSFYPHCIKSWNEIGPEFREAVSLSVFKTNILKLIRPPGKEIFHGHGPQGIKILSDSCWHMPLKISQEEI